MYRLSRILAFVAAGALLFVGSFYMPWATFNNLSGPEKYELTDASFEKLRRAKVPDQVIESLLPLRGQVFAKQQDFLDKLPRTPEWVKYRSMISNAACAGRVWGFSNETGPRCELMGGYARGDFAFTAYTFKGPGGAMIKMAGDRDSDLAYIQAFEELLKDNRDQDYELVESHPVGTNIKMKDGGRQYPYGNYAPYNVLAIIVLCAATFTRAKALTTVLALPTVVCGVLPLIVMKGWVADAAKLSDYGIVLDPAIGSGSYVMAAASILAAVGAALVWLAPRRPVRDWEMMAQVILGLGLVAGAVMCFLRADAAFNDAEVPAIATNEIETQLKNHQWPLPRVDGEIAVQKGRALTEERRRSGYLWIGGGAAGLLVGGYLAAAGLLKRKRRVQSALPAST